MAMVRWRGSAMLRWYNGEDAIGRWQWKDDSKTMVSRGIIIAVSRHRNRTINLKAEVIYVIKLLVAGIPYSDRATKFNIAPSRFGSMKGWHDCVVLMLQSRWSDTPSYHHQYFIVLSSSRARHRAIDFCTCAVYKRNGVKYAYSRCTVTDSKHNLTFLLFLVYLKLGVLIFLMIIKASKSILWWWWWGGGCKYKLEYLSSKILIYILSDVKQKKLWKKEGN